MPVCPIHLEEAVWRDRYGYWHCPACLAASMENTEALWKKLESLGIDPKTVLVRDDRRCSFCHRFFRTMNEYNTHRPCPKLAIVKGGP